MVQVLRTNNNMEQDLWNNCEQVSMEQVHVPAITWEKF